MTSPLMPEIQRSVRMRRDQYRPQSMDAFVTGGTGYIGQLLIPELQTRGHHVRVLARPPSTCRVPAGAMPVVGDALEADSVTAALKPGEAVIHLVGTPHPNPSKAKSFRKSTSPLSVLR